MIFTYVILCFGFICGDRLFFSIVLGFKFMILLLGWLGIICIGDIVGNLVIVSIIYDFVTRYNIYILYR